MIFCGGINQNGLLEDTVFKGYLNLAYEADDDCKVDFKNSRVKSATIKVEHLYPNEERRNADGDAIPVYLKASDRFFYNQVFYLKKPIEAEEGSFDAAKFFDKNRYIGMAGREALHVFDLEKMEFILADKTQGYINLV